jgi:large subunit ribosomal protein L1
MPQKNNEGTVVGSEVKKSKPTAVKKAGPKAAKAVKAANVKSERKQKASAKTASKKKTQSPDSRLPATKIDHRHGKSYRQAAQLVEAGKLYDLAEALELAQKTAQVKFDASVDLHVNLGVDPKQSDQVVRTQVTLPAGTGKSLRVAVVAPANTQAEAKSAGADLVGEVDLVSKIEQGQTDFDVLIATPDMMPQLGKAAKVLGPKGLMPNPKSGSVTTDVTKAVQEAKAGRVEVRLDKQAIIHQAIGKVSFKPADLLENSKALIGAIMKAKPSATKGTYVLGLTVATSMGPGIKLNVQKAIAESSTRK